jgi:hypothetical protein
MIATLIQRFVPLLILSSTSTSTSTKEGTGPLWNLGIIKTEMKSRSTWMHAILALWKAVGICLNLPCTVNSPLYTDYQCTWRISSWCISMQMKMSMKCWKEGPIKKLHSLLGLKSIKPIHWPERQPIRTFQAHGCMIKSRSVGSQDRGDMPLAECTLHHHLLESASMSVFF